jgi:hypothetical protein
MISTTEFVTPTLAAQWLRANTRNRPLSARVVERIAEEIRGGGWVVNGDAIRFGADGTLYDGQHRLNAIVQAGVGVLTGVVRGLAPEARDRIDVGGRDRTARDVVQITDEIRITPVAAAWYSAAELMLRDRTFCGENGGQTPEDLRAAISHHQAAVAALTPALSIGGVRRIATAAVVGCILIVWRTHPAEMLDFATRLKSGENLAHGNPILTMRNHLISNAGKTAGAQSRNEIALRTFAAIDAHLRGSTLLLVRPNATARDKYIDAWLEAAGEQ